VFGKICNVGVGIVDKTIPPSEMKKHIRLTEVIIGIRNAEQIACSPISPLIDMIYREVGGPTFSATIKNR
jgi:hypothetical protein